MNKTIALLSLMFVPTMFAMRSTTIPAQRLRLEGTYKKILMYGSYKDLAAMLKKITDDKNNRVIVYTHLATFDATQFQNNIEQLQEKMRYEHQEENFRFRYCLPNNQNIIQQAQAKSAYERNLGISNTKITDQYLKTMLKFDGCPEPLAVALVLNVTGHTLENVEIELNTQDETKSKA